MKEMFTKISDKVSETTGTMMEGFENLFSLEKLADKFSDMSDASKEKYTKYNNDLISLSPIIEEIGFKTSEIELSMGIPPSFTFHFEKIKDTSPERRQEILAQHSENKLLKPIVKMLIAADNYQDKIKLGSFKFSCIEVSLGLTPGVNLILTPKG
ncbi:MAG: hypothetical protein H6550_13055 [Chitinophagales bacterium]|nr:hypothetical protein [Chitinophagales bacterium]